MVVLRSKVLLLGDSEVGKSSIIQWLISNGKNINKNYIMTSTVELNIKSINIPDSDMIVELYLCDISGNDIFNDLRNNICQNASLVALVYDATNPSTFSSITKWYSIAHEYFQSRKIKGVLIANKVDNLEAIAVTRQQGEQLANELGLEYFETSATESKDVDIPFNFLADLFSTMFAERIKSLES